MYIHMYTHICDYVISLSLYIYIYIEREREREREIHSLDKEFTGLAGDKAGSKYLKSPQSETTLN